MLFRDNKQIKNYKFILEQKKQKFIKQERNKIITNLNYIIKKQKVVSGASRKYFLLKRHLPLLLKTKLIGRKKRFAGRNNKGRIILNTRGRSIKKLYIYNINPLINFGGLFFIGSFVFDFFFKKNYVLLFFGCGIKFYFFDVFNKKLFEIFKLKNFINKVDSDSGFWDEILYNLYFLPFMKPVAYLSFGPLKPIKYAKSSGSSAIIKKKDFFAGSAMLKLPSGVIKIFSIYSTGFSGTASLGEKKLLSSTRFGKKKQLGFKSKVRGVAMNPIDHPHGGRTKTISYPRTPWGKTTKFK